jgi:hypothetical protein
MKTILWLLLLLPGIAAGQIYIDSYKFAAAAPSGDLILDSIPDALVAYSLRKLDKDYTGNVLTIRNDNGDTLNVGFSGDYIDTVAIKNHCGTGAGDSCRVRRWYDQSGNARNLAQSTVSRQPLIMVNGVLMRSNGDVCIDFVDQFLDVEAGEVSTSGAITMFFALVLDLEITSTLSPAQTFHAANAGDVGRNNFWFGPVTSALTNERESWIYFVAPNVFAIAQTTSNVAADDYIYSLWAPHTSTTAKMYRNNTNLTISTAGTAGNFAPRNFFRIGSTSSATNVASNFFNGKAYEVIVYNSDKDADVNKINTNINTFYSIY